MLNVFQPTLGDAEIAAVREVFESGWIGRGKRTARFEEEFSGHLGVARELITSVSSCTEGLFIAMELIGAGPGDEVIIPTIGFIGAANSVASRGARPVFCDVDPRTLNARAGDIEARLSARTKAVIIVHYGGRPGDVAAIAALCRDRGVTLVEDSACSVASRVDGVACGTFGDIGAWSFDSMKILVTGDGGMLYLRDRELAARAAKVAYLGLEQASGFSQVDKADRWWEFEISSFSRRSTSNDLTSAIGSVQLRRLPGFIARRQAIAAYYDRELAAIGGVRVPPPLPPGHQSSHWLYWIQLDAGIRDSVARRLYDRGVYTTLRYPPLHKVRLFGDSSVLPRAEQAARETLNLPMHQALDDAAVDTVVAEVRAAVAGQPAAR